MNSEVVLGVLNRSLFAGRGIENIRVEIFGIFALFHLVNDLSWKQMNATYRFSEKKKKTDNCLQSFCWWSCTKTGRLTPYLFLDWRISTTNERNIPHLRKKTVVAIPPGKTAQGMKLWTKSHQLCASTSKINFLVTCGVSANWITLSPLSLKAAKFLWFCLCLASTEILFTKKKKE